MTVAIQLADCRFVAIRLVPIAAACIAAVPAQVANAQPPVPASATEQAKLFENHVRPLLATRCYKCHGSKQQQNGLRLDSLAAMLAGGESGPAVVPGKPEESLLVQAVRHESFEMPSNEQLAASDIESLVTWIRSGAAWPSHASNTDSSGTATITEEDRAFWSFRPIQDPPVPQVADGGWSRNAIDCFVYDKLRQLGIAAVPGPLPPAPLGLGSEEGMVGGAIAPAEEADRRTLIRRLYSDLIGLPPAPDEIDAFLADDSPTAYEQLVDRLLASPHYGERWGRRWLDLVRYAESDGHGNDQYRPTAWRYRDYVVRAFNEDKPYDRFVQEQLAADEIAPDDPAANPRDK